METHTHTNGMKIEDKQEDWIDKAYKELILKPIHDHKMFRQAILKHLPQ